MTNLDASLIVFINFYNSCNIKIVQKNVKIYLILSLICLQIVAPFIHAHAFGLDSLKAHFLHVHTLENDNANSTNGALTHAHIGENEIIGAITTVASGIKTSLADTIADGIAAFAIFFTLALLIFDVSARYFSKSGLVLFPQRYAYFRQNPRAPPT